MSAIREVKYLRELSHPNVIEVWRRFFGYLEYTKPTSFITALGRVFFKDEP